MDMKVYGFIDRDESPDNSFSHLLPYQVFSEWAWEVR